MKMKPINIVVVVLVLAVVGLGGWIIASKFGLVAPPIKASRTMPTSQGNPKNKNAYLSIDDKSVDSDHLGPRKWKIIDVHEHMKGETEATELMLPEMDKLGIRMVALQASTTYTLTLNPIFGFEGFKENSEALLQVKKNHPGRFAVFVTFDPCDGEDKVALMKDYVARGADGVKLYLGHGASAPKFTFHCEPLDHESMMPFYAWAEEVNLPIVFHINLEKFWDETLRVLEKHPYLRLDIPHFGLHSGSEQKLARLAFLLDRYPNVYSDISFGFHTFQLNGFEKLAKFRTRSRDFLTAHRNKFLYASDMVLEPAKDIPYVDNTLRSYMQFLEQDKWRFSMVPSKTMHGMGLDDETLRHIYEVAPSRFLLLDENGRLPDRTKDPHVMAPRPVIPPLTPDMIPPLGGKPKTPPTPTPTPTPTGLPDMTPIDGNGVDPPKPPPKPPTPTPPGGELEDDGGAHGDGDGDGDDDGDGGDAACDH